jgi:hypothetical protein
MGEERAVQDEIWEYEKNKEELFEKTFGWQDRYPTIQNFNRVDTFFRFFCFFVSFLSFL